MNHVTYGPLQADRVSISAAEYACLVSANERLEMLRRVVEKETDEYGDYEILRLILGIEKKKKEGE